MSDRSEASAVRFNERLNARSCRAKPEMWTVTATAGPFELGRALKVVQDVGGPIVTGVLGGD